MRRNIGPAAAGPAGPAATALILLQNKRFSVISWFFVATGAYSQSLCEFFSV